MVAVLHEQYAGVGLKLCQHLDYFFALGVAAKEHLQKAEIHIKGILTHTGAHKTVNRVFQTQPVGIHLHIVGNLTGLGTAAIPIPEIPFGRLEAKFLARIPNKI